jgi:hypothetical protein
MMPITTRATFKVRARPVAISGSGSITIDPVLIVLRDRSNFQVGGIHTFGIIALVADAHPGGNLSLVNRVAKAMRALCDPIDFEVCISINIERSDPRPALIILPLVHAAPESIHRMLSRGSL